MGRILDAIFGSKSEPDKPEQKRNSLFSTHESDYQGRESVIPAMMAMVESAQPAHAPIGAMDDSTNGQPLFKSFYNNQASFSQLIIA